MSFELFACFEANRSGAKYRLAQEYGLDLVYYSKFDDIFFEEKENPDFARLMSTMHVINAQGESDMDEEMWEAASKCAAICAVTLLTLCW